MRINFAVLTITGVLMLATSSGHAQQVSLEPLGGDIEKIIKESYPDVGLVTVYDTEGNITALLEQEKSKEITGSINMPEANNVGLLTEEAMVYDVNPRCIVKKIGGSLIVISGDPSVCLRN